MFRVLLLVCVAQTVLAASTGKSSQCGPNEIDTSQEKCVCEWELSCDAPIPSPCPDTCAKRKCTCKEGFYRTRDNTKCVPWKECPGYEKTYGLCALVFCADGTCEDVETECGNPPCPLSPHCKPVPRTFNDCSLYPCRRCDEYCMMINEPACFHGNCTMHPECIPKNVDSCADSNCSDGTVCRMIPVQCFTCPCYPKPECVKF